MIVKCGFQNNKLFFFYTTAASRIRLSPGANTLTHTKSVRRTSFFVFGNLFPKLWYILNFIRNMQMYFKKKNNHKVKYTSSAVLNSTNRKHEVLQPRDYVSSSK